MHVLYLGLGSNLGDTRGNLTEAIRLINDQIGEISAQSEFYASEPWGFVSENSFTNAVVQLKTTLSPKKILESTQRIEREMGRTQKSVSGYSDRIIDIDLLDYDGLVINEKLLTLPHPYMHQRAFVMKPFCDIAPQWEHPIFKLSAELLYKELMK